MFLSVIKGYKVVFCGVRTNHTRGVGYLPRVLRYKELLKVL